MRKLCDQAGVSSSGFYSWKKPKKKDTSQEEFNVFLVTTIFGIKKRKAGAKTIRMILKRDFDVLMNLKKIRRIMRENGLVTQIRRKNKFNSFIKMDHEHKAVPNYLNRAFDVEKPNMVYVLDISYIEYGSGQRAYLFAVKDLCSKDIVHYTLMKTLHLDLLLQRLEIFLARIPKRIRDRLMIHSDQGGHFTCDRFRNLLMKLGIKQSMSRRGNCHDNAPIESFFGHLKDEVELKNCRKFEELEIEIRKFVDYYNFDRPQWGLKGKTPAESRGSNFRVFY